MSRQRTQKIPVTLSANQRTAIIRVLLFRKYRKDELDDLARDNPEILGGKPQLLAMHKAAMLEESRLARLSDDLLLHEAREEVHAQEIINGLIKRGDELRAEEAIQQEKMAISEKQSKIASKPRPDSLQKLIIEIVKSQPNIKLPGLLEKLKQEARLGVVDEVDNADENIVWHHSNGQVEDTPIKALKDRLSRARKKLSSR